MKKAYTSYRCQKCQSFFEEPLQDKGVFVCPNCKSSDFEKIECKKNMDECN